MQQLHAEPALQTGDALADKGLAHAEHIRRGGEAPGLDDRLEDAHLQQSFVLHFSNPRAPGRLIDPFEDDMTKTISAARFRALRPAGSGQSIAVRERARRPRLISCAGQK